MVCSLANLHTDERLVESEIHDIASDMELKPMKILEGQRSAFTLFRPALLGSG